MPDARLIADLGPRLLQLPAKRSIGLIVIGIASFWAMLFCYLFLFWNLVVIYEYFHSTGAAAASNPVADSAAHAAAGLWTRIEIMLRSWSVDLSAQTPFKLSLFTTLLFFSCARSLTGKLSDHDLRVRSTVLPFFSSLETTFVQLGLAGSIWGFLLIGFSIKEKNLTTQAADALQILLRAFGTALLSTFTGVMLAFVAAPLIRGLWRRLHDIPATAPSIASGINNSMIRLKETFEEVTKPTERLRDTLTELRGSGTELDGSLGKVRGSVDDLTKRIGELDPKQVQQNLSHVANGVGDIQGRVVNIEANGRATGDALSLIAGHTQSIDQHTGASTSALGMLTELARETVAAVRQVTAAVGEASAVRQREAATSEELLRTIAHQQQIANDIGGNSMALLRQIEHRLAIIAERPSSVGVAPPAPVRVPYPPAHEYVSPVEMGPIVAEREEPEEPPRKGDGSGWWPFGKWPFGKRNGGHRQ